MQSIHKMRICFLSDSLPCIPSPCPTLVLPGVLLCRAQHMLIVHAAIMPAVPHTHTHKHARTLRANCMWNLGSCAGCALKISPNATHLFFICANVWPKHKDTNTYIYIYPCECVCVSSAPYFALPEEIRILQQTRFVSFTCEIIN